MADRPEWEPEGSSVSGSLEQVASWRDKRGFRRRIWDWLRAERAPLTLPTSGPAPKRSTKPNGEPSEAIGICFSGGGIRSAAYNLGALQVLERKGVLRHSDYLAAVSGGAYLAGAFATVRASSDPAALSGDVPVYAPGSPEEIHLRNRSSYLAPGLGGKLRLLLRLLLGLIVNLTFILALVVVAAALVALLYVEALHEGLAKKGVDYELDLEAWMLIVPGALAGVFALLMLPDLIVRLPYDAWRRFLERWATRLAGLALLSLALLIGLPLLLDAVRGAPEVAPLVGLTPVEEADTRGGGLLELLGIGALASTALSALGAFLLRKRLYVAIIIGAVAGPLAILGVLVYVVNEMTVDGFTGGDWRVLGIAAAIFVVATIFADITQWSPHPFYRRQLSSAFFVRRISTDEVEEMPFDARLPLENLDREAQPGGPQQTKPEVIICAAVNLSDQGATPPGRNAASFTFSGKEIGGPLVGTVDVGEFERTVRGNGEQAEQDARSRDLTIPAAVAMSGAAVSPVMGRKGVRALSVVFGLANVRLGAWLPNPRSVTELRGRLLVGWRGWSGLRSPIFLGKRLVPPPRYILHELLGTTSIRHNYLYVSDGGHFENLGLVELLRRGCTTIFCFDASGDRQDTFDTIGEAIAIARTDLQVDIHLDTEQMKVPEGEEWAAKNHILGSFRYRDETEWGTLVFAKSAVTADAPWDVKAFRLRNKRFPNHSTFDQLFDEEKFEAYRALGAHAAEQAVEAFKEKLNAELSPDKARAPGGSPGGSLGDLIDDRNFKHVEPTSTP